MRKGVIGREYRTGNMFDLLQSNPAKMHKGSSLPVELDTWNTFDDGKLFIFPSGQALKGISGAWLCAIVLVADDVYVSGLWSPMYARHAALGAPGGMVFHGGGEGWVHGTRADAFEASMLALREAGAEFQRGKERFQIW